MQAGTLALQSSSILKESAMKIVYATGKPRAFDFAVAPAWGALPADAIVFAVCQGDSCREDWDERLFHSMSDAEFYTLRGMIRAAMQFEAESFTATAYSFAGWWRGLRHRFFKRGPVIRRTLSLNER
jgi:hypothetical protein